MRDSTPVNWGSWMKQVRRYLFNFATAVSFLFCVAISSVAVLSHWHQLHFNWGRDFTIFPEYKYIWIQWNSHHEKIPWSGSSYFVKLREVDLAGSTYEKFDIHLYLQPSVAIADHFIGSALHLKVWHLVVFFMILPALWLFQKLRNRSPVKEGFCPACGYDLRATPDRCPECGRAAVTHPP